jgi:hypothetical protein
MSSACCSLLRAAQSQPSTSGAVISYLQAAWPSFDLLAVGAFLLTWFSRECICVGVLLPLKMLEYKAVLLETLDSTGCLSFQVFETK